MSLHQLYPVAPIYTLVENRDLAPWARDISIKTSFLQKLSFARSFHEFFPVIPVFAFESFSFSEYDVVISVTSAEAKGIITSPRTLHICYLLTPTRYLWSHYGEYFKNKMLRIASLPIVVALRMWDFIACHRPDRYVMISGTTKKRAQKYYGKTGPIIYPPVNTDYFRPVANTKKDTYFLVVSRLVGYKHVELAIAACNELKLPLKIVGEGWERKKLVKLAGPTIEFLGNLTDKALFDYYQNCRALIFPQEEDFGISLIEALACGKPVIAFKSGGAREIIREGITGTFFAPQTKEALTDVLNQFDESLYNTESCRRQAIAFSETVFRHDFGEFVESEWQKFRLKLKL